MQFCVQPLLFIDLLAADNATQHHSAIDSVKCLWQMPGDSDVSQAMVGPR
jgi:hypothetical protein